MTEKQNIQYRCNVKNGVVNQEGFLFKALPFKIQYLDNEINVEFKRVQSEVVYELTDKKGLILQLEYPDYAPDCTIELVEQVFGISKIPIIALIYIGLIQKTSYKSFFNENGLNNVSFNIIQLSNT